MVGIEGLETGWVREPTLFARGNSAGRFKFSQEKTERRSLWFCRISQKRKAALNRKLSSWLNRMPGLPPFLPRQPRSASEIFFDLLRMVTDWEIQYSPDGNS